VGQQPLGLTRAAAARPRRPHPCSGWPTSELKKRIRRNITAGSNPIRDRTPTLGAERDALAQQFDYQRETILIKTDGLTREQLAQQLPASALTLAGILYHLALVEEGWLEVRYLGLPRREEWQGVDWDADPDWEFRTATTMEPEQLRRRYRDACNRSRQAAAKADSLDQLSAVKLGNGEQFTLRWVLLHLIEETASTPGTPTCSARRSTARSASSGYTRLTRR
jgi:uncharacterized damage-inducible protein DinB